jgi:hypothetical protein
MEDISVLQKTRIAKDKKVRVNYGEAKHSTEVNKTSPVTDRLISQVDENFYNYLNCLGLANEPNLMVLPSSQHYYYDNEDLKGITTLINLKKLNLIKQLDDFIYTVYNIISPKTNFVGCFTDWRTQKGMSLFSRMYRRFINFLDLKVDIEIEKKDILRLFQSHGFKVIDMTEINGLTYFRTQN